MGEHLQTVQCPVPLTTMLSRTGTICTVLIRGIKSPGLLHVVRWFGTDVSGLPIGSIFKGQAGQMEDSILPAAEP